jgi:chaperone required for assembly of F1-ATPase
MSDETEDERARRLLTRQGAVNLPKRFYKQVSVAQADGGFEVAA